MENNNPIRRPFPGNRTFTAFWRDLIRKTGQQLGIGPQRVLLSAMLMAEYDRPEVSFTKAQIAEAWGGRKDLRHIQYQIAALRAAGILTPIRNELGGRGNPVVYQITEPNLDTAKRAEAAKKIMRGAGYRVSD